MFGYVTICKENLSEQGYNTFKAYYCGLCKTVGKRCSHSARMGLSYDITFLAIVLSSLQRGEVQLKDKKCLLHPISENICAVNDTALEYSADMGVILTYLKFLDDWHDEKSIKALFLMMIFHRAVKKSKKRYPKVYEGIRACLTDLRVLEKEKCTEIDETADCFAKILKILFTPDFIPDEKEKRILAWLGYNIGRWIYIIDAYNDLEKDMKKNGYNTFLEKYKGMELDEIKSVLKEKLDVTMTFTLENAAAAYDLLTVHRNREILDNIIYDALKKKQNFILGENNESI